MLRRNPSLYTFIASLLFLCAGAAWGRWAAAAAAAAASGGPAPATVEDFFQPGTQPGGLIDGILPSIDCAACHAGYDPEQEPYTHWAASMMGQAGRDPIFYACLAIANQDVASAGELCLRCHTPGAWLAGRSSPPDGSALDPSKGDLDGVTCHVCHRMVDTLHEPGVSPRVDLPILQALLASSPVPEDAHNGQYVLDPLDRRRGPFELTPGFNYHPWVESPFHREARMCATCHDVSNPLYSRDPSGAYLLNELDAPAPSFASADLFPIERTFSEWEHSAFALAELDMGGRFGGAKAAVATCQDCHMPDVEGRACSPFLPLGQDRPDVPKHDFNGVNSWVLEAVHGLFPSFETGLSDAQVALAIARNVDMQQRAADLWAFERKGQLVVRVVNQTGHKLPTGYGEGRRMWLEVQVFGPGDQLLVQHGAYDMASASLASAGTTVFEIQQGLDEAAAAAAGLSPGASFHFALNNKVFHDNRIPPRGFRNEPYDRAGAAPVGASYADQQHWHESTFALPLEATRVVVNLWHQTTTREYVEFLRDENHTNAAGQLAYDLWVQHGQSAPVLKASAALDLALGACPAPVEYGLGNLSSRDRRATLAGAGRPSLAANDFAILVEEGLPGARGALYCGDALASVPFAGGFQLTAARAGGGRASCIGFVFDAEGRALVPIPIDASMVDTTRYYQAVFHDPGAGRPGLSSGLMVDVCP